MLIVPLPLFLLPRVLAESNMELPMAHALTRNRTYRALDHLGMCKDLDTFLFIQNPHL